MYEADMSVTQMALSGRFAGDNKVYAEFIYHPRKNAKKSLEEGRDIFEDVPYIKIMVPGDKDNVVFRPIRDADKERFPRQWQAFKNKETQPLEGTPLTEWPMMTKSQVEEMKFFGIQTVEALANMPDSQSGKFMGINEIKKKAKAWLEDTKMTVPMLQLEAENKKLKAEIEAIKAQLSGDSTIKKRTRRKVDDGEIQVSE